MKEFRSLLLPGLEILVVRPDNKNQDGCVTIGGPNEKQMRYQEFKPPAELAPWIKLFWIVEDRSHEPTRETVVADGCPELIIHFRSPFSELNRLGQWLVQPTAITCGQLTEPLELQSSTNAGMIGIRFSSVRDGAVHCHFNGITDG